MTDFKFGGCPSCGSLSFVALQCSRDDPPQASRPLTDDEWFDFWRDNDAAPGSSVFPEFLRLARAIEAAHGIGAAQEGQR